MKQYLFVIFTLLALLNANAQTPFCTEKTAQSRLFLKNDSPIEALQGVEDALRQCPQYPEAHYLKGEILGALIRHEEAITAFLNAAELLRQQNNNDSLLVEALHKAARSCIRTSQYTKGLAAIDEAIQRQEQRTGPYNTAFVNLLMTKSILAINAPDTDPAPIIRYAGQCLSQIQNPNPKTLVDYHLSIGLMMIDRGTDQANDSPLQRVYYAQGDSAFQNALAVRSPDPVQERNLRGAVHFSIGESYQLRKQYDLAEQHFRQSMKLLDQATGTYIETRNWSFTCLVRNMYPQGKYRECIALADSLLATIHYRPGRLDTCPYLGQAMGVLERKLMAMYQLCLLENSPQRCAEALQLCQEALDLIDYRISKTERNLLKYREVEKAANMYDVIANILFLDKSDASLQLLFQISERNKNYLLNHAQIERSAMQLANIPPELVKREENWRKDIHQKEKELTQEYRTDTTENEKKQLLYRDLATLYHRYDSLKANIRSQFPEYFDYLLNKNIITIADVQQQLRPEQTMLEYFITKEFLYVFVINRDAYEVHRVAYNSNLQTLIRQFHQSVYRPYTDATRDDLYQECADLFSQAGHQLYLQLLAPYRDRLGKDLLIIPDGLLNFVSFEALLTEPATKSTRFGQHAYLIRQFTVSYAYSATLLRSNQQKEVSKNGIPFLGIAPSFPGNITPMSGNRQGIKPLLHNTAEVTEIQSIMGGEIVAGAHATKAKFMDIAHRYQVIHLATHAESMDKIGDYAFLAFTPVGGLDSLRLFSKEIYNLSLHANMVVLSACQTGIGELKRGEGVISLARAFMYAGAKSIITTLWSVDDHKTKELMVDFYQQLKKGQPKDHALRNAKLHYLQRHNGEEAHPFYWAGFIGLGDMTAF